MAARIHANDRGYGRQLVAHIIVVAGGNGHGPADTDYTAFHNLLHIPYIGHDDGGCGGDDETSLSLSL